jgi:adenosylcobinamide kinase / adenosylcobinamide-phosphate guanylyltransferase
MSLTLLLGGVRAGKSARALSLAIQYAGDKPVLFVATAQAFDDDMRRRIDAHRRERPRHWVTLESPIHIATDLDAHLADRADSYGAVVLDCLTLWVSNLLLSLRDDDDAESVVADRSHGLLRALANRDALVVSNEVGLGVVPPTPLGRRYRDALGRANQIFAAAADDVRLLVAGIELPLKSRARTRE